MSEAIDNAFKHEYLKDERHKLIAGMPLSLVFNVIEVRRLIAALDNYQARIEQLERGNSELKQVLYELVDITVWQDEGVNTRLKDMIRPIGGVP